MAWTPKARTTDTTWTPKQRLNTNIPSYFLEIGGGYKLDIGGGYKLVIQPGRLGQVYTAKPRQPL